MKSPYDHGPPTDHRHANQQRDMLARRHCIKPGVSPGRGAINSPVAPIAPMCAIFHNGQTSLSGSPACQTIHHIGQTVLVESTGEDDEQEHQYHARDLGRKHLPRNRSAVTNTAPRRQPTKGNQLMEAANSSGLASCVDRLSGIAVRNCQANRNVRNTTVMCCAPTPGFIERGHLRENLDRGQDQTHAQDRRRCLPQPKIEIEQRFQPKMIQYRLHDLVRPTDGTQ